MPNAKLGHRAPVAPKWLITAAMISGATAATMPCGQGEPSHVGAKLGAAEQKERQGRALRQHLNGQTPL